MTADAGGRDGWQRGDGVDRLAGQIRAPMPRLEGGNQPGADGDGGLAQGTSRPGPTRRDLLRLAGLGAVATAAALAPPPGAAMELLAGAARRLAPPPLPSPLPSPPSPPSPPDWAKLRSRLAGSLVLPGDPGYDAARRSFNPLFDARRPAAVARCAGPADVQACVAAAAAARLPVAARGGGHSYAGYSTPEQGLVVDLGGMAGVDVRPDGTAIVGAGARLIDVYAALARAGRCLPAGSCPTVGIAGLTLGGGIGVLARKLGLTCDRLVLAQVVTADAVLRTVAEGADADLFWALRGGGGGNLGIVTSFTFSTAPAPALTVFSLRFPAGAAAAALAAWQAWAPTAPDELWSNCILSSGTAPACRAGGCYAGAATALAPLLDDLVRRAGARPASRSVRSMPCLDAMLYFGGCSRRSVGQCRLRGDGEGQLAREGFVASSRILTRPLADPARAVALLDRPPSAPAVDLLFDALGGEVGRVPAAATAFPHRAALATVQVYAATGAADPRQPGRAGRAARAVAEVGTGLDALLGSGAGAYVNYLDPAMPDWAAACYGSNLGRLRAAARRYDPQGIFAFAQGLAERPA